MEIDATGTPSPQYKALIKSTPSTITNTQARVMLLKSFVRTGTLLAGARAFAPLAVQRRAFTKMSAAPIGVMVTVEIEEARVRSRRPVVVWWFYFIVVSRLRE